MLKILWIIMMRCCHYFKKNVGPLLLFKSIKLLKYTWERCKEFILNFQIFEVLILTIKYDIKCSSEFNPRVH